MAQCLFLLCLMSMTHAAPGKPGQPGHSGQPKMPGNPRQPAGNCLFSFSCNQQTSTDQNELKIESAKERYEECLKQWMVPDAGSIPKDEYLRYLPFCLTETTGDPSSCQYPELTPKYPETMYYLDKYFGCLNEYAKHTASTQDPHAQLVLWTGDKGMRKAEEIAKKDPKKTFSLPYQFIWDYLFPPPPGESFTDTKISALSISFGISKDAKATYKDSGSYSEAAIDATFKMFNNVNCVWLVYPVTTFPIHAYSSIGGYENHPVGGENPGMSSLLKANITKAIPIGSYFWETEMIILTHLKEKYEVSDIIFVHLMEYNEKGEMTDPDWKKEPINLFSANALDIPVIARYKDHSQYPLDATKLNIHSTGEYGQLTLGDLIGAYNNDTNNKDNPLKILGDNANMMILFTKWVRENILFNK